MQIDRRVLERETVLPDNDEDSLMGCETLEFERKRGMSSAEDYSLIPSVNAYDLPLISTEEDGALISEEMTDSAIGAVVLNAAQIVAKFERGHDDDVAGVIAKLKIAADNL